MSIVPINYLAVVVAAIVNFVLGWLWYGPLFSKPWAIMSGVSMDKKPEAGMMARSMIVMFIGSLLMAWILAHALVFGNAYLGARGVSSGLMVGFFNWLGFIAPVTIGVVLWENKPLKLWFINAGYYLVGLCLMGVILALWMK